MDPVLSVSKLGELYFYFPRTHVHIFIWTVNNSRVVWEHNRWTIGGRAMYQWLILCHCGLQGGVLGSAGGHLSEQRPQLPSGSMRKTKPKNKMKIQRFRTSSSSTLRRCICVRSSLDRQIQNNFLYLSNSKCYLYLLVLNRNTSFSSF